MSAVLYSIDSARAANVARASNRAKSKARAFGYCRTVQNVMGDQVADLMLDGMSEDDAIARIVKPKSARLHDAPDGAA